MEEDICALEYCNRMYSFFYVGEERTVKKAREMLYSYVFDFFLEAIWSFLFVIIQKNMRQLHLLINRMIGKLFKLFQRPMF